MSDLEKENANPVSRRLVYKKRPGTDTNPAGAQTQKTQSHGLTPEDLALFRELTPKLSPKGREIIHLLLSVFGGEGGLDLNSLLQMVSHFGGNNSNSSLSSSLTTIMPLLSSLSGNQSGNQGLNPMVLTSLLNLLSSSRPGN